MRKYLLNNRFVWMMTLWAALICIPPSNAFAFPSQSLSTVQPALLRQAQIDSVMDALSRPEAQLHMRLMHLDENQVRESLTKLDDTELAQVAQRADSVKAAGDAGLGLIIALLVIVLLVVLIVNLSNKKIVVRDAH